MGRRAFALAGLLGLGPAPAVAVDVQTLVMPGPVIQGHADVEDDCGKCHAAFDRAAQRGLCLDCHDEIAADLQAREGFHGRSPAVGEAQCRSCHTDHEGRDADVIGLNPATFDHALTDHPLRGAHVGVACQSCHAPRQDFRDAPGDCAACHREDDPHQGRLGERCADCHGESAWADARFDHSKTAFPLEGAHREVTCNLCHPAEQYEGTAKDCRSCHVLDDVHRGRFGARCETCHTAEAWKTVAFDHDRDTDYPLTGRHREAACQACHTGVLHQEDLATDCWSCHRADDEHRGRRGRDCGACHATTGWKTTAFDHDRDTRFPLSGSHREARCEACHHGVLGREDLATTCFGCHEADDVHQGQEGRDCGRCHDEQSWTERVRFDHDLTSFPLLGLHAVVACEECHPTSRHRDAETRCSACHADEFHEGRLGNDCAPCHNPNSWDRWSFDHDARTSFALHGAHVDVDCHACHAEPVRDELQLPGSCHACHAAEDVHSGGFGRDCGRCHGEASWRELEGAPRGGRPRPRGSRRAPGRPRPPPPGAPRPRRVAPAAPGSPRSRRRRSAPGAGRRGRGGDPRPPGDPRPRRA
jgi:hypothetical protein